MLDEGQKSTLHCTFDRILDNASPMFSASQPRVFLRALVHLDPYTFTDDVAEHFATGDEDKSSEEILLGVVEGLADDKLTGFALHLVLTGNLPTPRENEADSLAEAEAAFVNPKPKKTAGSRCSSIATSAAHISTSVPPASIATRPSMISPRSRSQNSRPTASVGAPSSRPVPGNFQAWLKHTSIFPKLLGTFAAQTLAARYDADPSAADWRRFGQLPGFTNCKPK